MTTTAPSTRIDPDRLAESVAAQVGAGGRFAGLVATARADGSTVLHALVARTGRLEVTESRARPGRRRSYPALTPLVPAAAWYEREIHDLFGIEPDGHPCLDPLVLPLGAGSDPPRPGQRTSASLASTSMSPPCPAT